jgi:hypothetical protein
MASTMPQAAALDAGWCSASTVQPPDPPPPDEGAAHTPLAVHTLGATQSLTVAHDVLH